MKNKDLYRIIGTLFVSGKESLARIMAGQIPGIRDGTGPHGMGHELGRKGRLGIECPFNKDKEPEKYKKWIETHKGIPDGTCPHGRGMGSGGGRGDGTGLLNRMTKSEWYQSIGALVSEGRDDLADILVTAGKHKVIKWHLTQIRWSQPEYTPYGKLVPKFKLYVWFNNGNKHEIYLPGNWTEYMEAFKKSLPNVDLVQLEREFKNK